MRGERALLGFIDLSTARTLLSDAFSVVPDGVSVICSRITLPGGVVTPEALVEMLEGSGLEDAAMALSSADPSVISFACTSGSLIRGLGYDHTIARRISAVTGIRGTTTSSAVVEALRALRVRRVTVGTPYVESVNEAERRFLTDSGFTVTAIEGLGLTVDSEIGRVAAAETLDFGRRLSREGAEAVFLSCTNLDALTSVDELEAELGIPVVTSNQATIWQALRMSGVDEPLPGFGRLLTLPLIAKDPVRNSPSPRAGE